MIGAREVEPFQGVAPAAHHEPAQETSYSAPAPPRRPQVATPAEVQALGRTHDLNVLLKPLTKQEALGEAVHLLVPRGEGRRMGMFSLSRRELLAAGLEGRIRPVIVGASGVFVLKVYQECPEITCHPLRRCRVCALAERRGPIDFVMTEPVAAVEAEGRFSAPFT